MDAVRIVASWRSSAERFRIQVFVQVGGDSFVYTGCQMETLFLVVCPYCGEEVEIYLEPDMHGSVVQDCEVCCNPWRLQIVDEDGERWVEVQRADGSE
jgi:hypothetical protein